MDQKVRELVLEGLRILSRSEVAAKPFASATNGACDPGNHLASTRFPLVRVSEKAGLAKVLRYDDIGRQLRPTRRHLSAVHFEHHGTIRIRDDAGAPLPDDAVERRLARLCVL